MSQINKFRYSANISKDTKVDAFAIGLFSDLKLDKDIKSFDKSVGKAISNSIESKLFDGSKDQIKIVPTNNSKVILLYGLGKRDELSSERIRRVGGLISKTAISNKIGSLSVVFPFKTEDDYLHQSFAEGIVLGSYQFNELKTEDKKFDPKSLTLVGVEKKPCEKGLAIGTSVCFARDIENRPGNIATPSHLALNAKNIAKNSKVKTKVFERQRFTKMGMGALSAVASGTEVPPKFILMEYYNAPKKVKPKVLVGKGLTFDSGGISIKPASKMDEMKFDMCGAGVVLGAMRAVSILKPKINLIGIIPSTENMSGDKAYRPGDVLTAYNGKTIEVLNTDAEGRLILADALSYASKHYDPEFILDFATLTGAVVVALGHIATGIMGTNDDLIKEIKRSSKITDEKVWEFPLWQEYLDQVKSQIADVKNLGSAGQAGTIAGGAFLKSFVKEGIPWCHFDIAGTAWGDRNLSYHNKGAATGEVIRLVIDLLGI